MPRTHAPNVETWASRVTLTKSPQRTHVRGPLPISLANIPACLPIATQLTCLASDGTSPFVRSVRRLSLDALSTSLDALLQSRSGAPPILTRREAPATRADPIGRAAAWPGSPWSGHCTDRVLAPLVAICELLPLSKAARDTKDLRRSTPTNPPRASYSTPPLLTPPHCHSGPTFLASPIDLLSGLTHPAPILTPHPLPAPILTHPPAAVTSPQLSPHTHPAPTLTLPPAAVPSPHLSPHPHPSLSSHHSVRMAVMWPLRRKLLKIPPCLPL